MNATTLSSRDHSLLKHIKSGDTEWDDRIGYVWYNPDEQHDPYNSELHFISDKQVERLEKRGYLKVKMTGVQYDRGIPHFHLEVTELGLRETKAK